MPMKRTRLQRMKLAVEKDFMYMFKMHYTPSERKKVIDQLMKHGD